MLYTSGVLNPVCPSTDCRQTGCYPIHWTHTVIIRYSRELNLKLGKYHYTVTVFDLCLDSRQSLVSEASKFHDDDDQQLDRGPSK